MARNRADSGRARPAAEKLEGGGINPRCQQPRRGRPEVLLERNMRHRCWERDEQLGHRVNKKKLYGQRGIGRTALYNRGVQENVVPPCGWTTETAIRRRGKS